MFIVNGVSGASLHCINFGVATEPSCGVGNFFGLLPDNMADSKRYGVELDAITGRIARQLYQNADIQIKGFEDADYPDNFFDLAIGNVPFGSYGVSDQRYDKYKFHIHDYFFAKAIDKVRPGGGVAFITSKGTLDKQDEKVRRYLAERAELLGAIRLPNNAFTANAGTEVTTDILFLQKRDRPMVTEPEWLYLGRTEDGVPINRYFLSHPEMLLGRMAWWKNMYGNQEETACLPLEGKDLAAQLAEAISHIRGQIQSWELEEAGEQGEWLPADPSIPNFSFGLLEGNLYYRMDSQMQPAAASATALARIRAMIGLRECTRRLMQYQLENHPEARIRQEQERLNALYDRFVEQYGRITSRGNKSAFRDDASYPLLCSLEVLDEEGKFQCKAAMFTRRTIRAQTPVSHVDTPEEALALSIGERARVDIAYMAAVTGMDEASLAQQLQGYIYRDFDGLDPLDMDWASFNIRSFPFITADEYLSGNVRHMLEQLMDEEYNQLWAELLDVDLYGGLTYTEWTELPSRLPAGDTGSSIAAAALSKVGTAYSVMDCSQLTQYAYGQAGITLPRTSVEQAKYCYNNGYAISSSQLQPGDLIFWSKACTCGRWNEIHHTGIYIGDGRIVDASSSKGRVVLRSLWGENGSAWKIVLYARPHV